MAKKKKKALSRASKKRTSKKKPTAPRKRSIKEKPTQARTKKSRGAKKGSSKMRLTWDLATLLENGLPSDGTRSDAYRYVCDEGVSLTWIFEVLSEVRGRAVSESEVRYILELNGVPMLTLEVGDDGQGVSPSHMPNSDYRTLMQMF